MTYGVHILAGGLALVSGYLALSVKKGSTLHRKSGQLFVGAMLTVAMFGIVMAVGQGVAPAVNIPAALMSAYLVVTSLSTVRPPAAGARWLHVGAMLVALATGLTSLGFGFEAVAAGGTRNGMPAFPFFMFGLVGVIGSVGDMRILRSGALKGASRLARHLWRMCFALFIAALSFFIGQSDEFPQALRVMPLLALPVLTVLVSMFYWLWRVRIRRSLRGVTVRDETGRGQPAPLPLTPSASRPEVLQVPPCPTVTVPGGLDAVLQARGIKLSVPNATQLVVFTELGKGRGSGGCGSRLQ